MADIRFEYLEEGALADLVTADLVYNSGDKSVAKTVIVGKGDGYPIYWHMYNKYNRFTCVDKKDPSSTWTIPVRHKTITGNATYGMRINPGSKEKKKHNGVDLSHKGCSGSPILAVASGKVTTADFSDSMGHYVVIEHDDPIGGEKVYTKYMHMGPATMEKDSNGKLKKKAEPEYSNNKERYAHIVKKGESVTAGQIIGSIGTSGNSTGYHLHFGLFIGGTKNKYSVDPQDYIDFSSSANKTPNQDIPNGVGDVTETIVPDLVVQKSEITHDDFQPLFDNNYIPATGKYSSQSMHARRGKLLQPTVLFNGKNINNGIGTGISCIGPVDYTNHENDPFNPNYKVETDENYFSSSINPHLDSSKNNAYAWGRAASILKKLNLSDRQALLCKKHSDNWYANNIENRSFEYGATPRKYSLACWLYTKNDFSKTRVAVVEKVFGTDMIEVSECEHKTDDKYNYDENTVTITNSDSNWGQDKSQYKFLGFIYLAENDILSPGSFSHELNGVKITSTTAAASETGVATQYSTALFGISNIKHYNKIRIIGETEVTGLTNQTETSDDGIYIMLSQQVISCENTDENWFETGFDPLVEYDNDNSEFTHNMPFPNGAIQLAKIDGKASSDKGKLRLDATFAIDTCKITQEDESTKVINTFSSDEYLVFNRELPTYITFTTQLTEDSNTSSNASVSFTVKEIILYG